MNASANVIDSCPVSTVIKSEGIHNSADIHRKKKQESWIWNPRDQTFNRNTNSEKRVKTSARPIAFRGSERRFKLIYGLWDSLSIQFFRSSFRHYFSLFFLGETIKAPDGQTFERDFTFLFSYRSNSSVSRLYHSVPCLVIHEPGNNRKVRITRWNRPRP